MFIRHLYYAEIISFNLQGKASREAYNYFSIVGEENDVERKWCEENENDQAAYLGLCDVTGHYSTLLHTVLSYYKVCFLDHDALLLSIDNFHGN